MRGGIRPLDRQVIRKGVSLYGTLESKKGVSANQIKWTVRVTYKTAWYLCHRIRDAMKDSELAALGGTVEVVTRKAPNRSRPCPGYGHSEHASPETLIILPFEEVLGS